MVVVPRIHLNGTAAKDLVEQQREVLRIANVLLIALRDASPNARDFYPLEPGSFERAVSQHRARVDAVEKVVEESKALFEALYEQKEALDARRGR
jgi:hypothetical protein